MEDEMKMKTGIELIADERQRQITKEGWTLEHDKEHDEGALREGALCYLARELEENAIWNPIPERMLRETADLFWPWRGEFEIKPTTLERNLVKAGALIAAELDRLRSPL